MASALVHLAAGVGNIVLATPLLVALEELRIACEVRVDADYAGAGELLRGWSAVREIHAGRDPRQPGRFDYVIPAVPPFYWPRFAALYRGDRRALPRPAEALFYANEQEFYVSFARQIGYGTRAAPFYRLPIGPSESWGVNARTIVLAPGCKTGDMAAKRWPHFSELAQRLERVAVVGTRDDLRDARGAAFRIPSHAIDLVDKLSLRETAAALASAGAAVGNDSGLSHIAAAVGTPTLMLFGPTPDRELGALPPNAEVLRRGLACEPCWFGRRFEHCAGRIDCLAELAVDEVERRALRMLA